jgi:hypothetical protein
LDHLDAQEKMQITHVFEMEPVAKVLNDIVDEC